MSDLTAGEQKNVRAALASGKDRRVARIEPMRGPDAVPAPSELHAGRQTGIVGILALALEVRQAAGADGIAPVTIELGAGPRRGSASSAYERIT